MKEISSWCCLIILLFFCSTIKTLVHCSVVPDLVCAIQAHLWTGCVFLVILQGSPETDIGVKRNIIQLQLDLSQRQVPTAALDGTSVRTALEFFVCQRNRPLYTLIASDENSPSLLEKLFADSYVSEPRWLLFLSGNQSVDNFLSDVNIPFDCEFLVAMPCFSDCDVLELVEVYRVSRTHPLQTSRWGSWSSTKGLTFPVNSLYQRRHNLQGITLTGSSYRDPPFSTLTKKESGDLKAYGMFAALCEDLADILNFNLHVVETDPEDYNRIDDNGTWGGEVGMILRGELDLTLTGEYITGEATGVVGFSIPLLQSKSCIFIRAEDSSGAHWKAILSPFSATLWLAVGACFLCISCCLASADLLARRFIRYKQRHLLGFGFRDSLLCVWGAFCSQSYSRTHHLWSGRLIQWTGFVTAYTILTAYSATFISELTTSQTVLPFAGLEDILRDNTYSFGVLRDSELYTTFQNSSDVVLQEIYKNKLLPNKDSLPEDNLLGFETACNHLFAFMTECDYILALENRLPCKLSTLPESSFPLTTALFLPRTSPYLKLFNSKLREMRDYGLVRRQQLDKQPRFYREDNVKVAGSIDFWDVVPLLTLVALGCVMGTTIMVVQRVIDWRERKDSHLLQYLRV